MLRYIFGSSNNLPQYPTIEERREIANKRVISLKNIRHTKDKCNEDIPSSNCFTSKEYLKSKEDKKYEIIARDYLI